MGGLFGGSPSYDVEETPEKQTTKSLSAGATAAAESQREKAKKNRGIAASILTERNSNGSGGLASNSTGSSTLG